MAAPLRYRCIDPDYPANVIVQPNCSFPGIISQYAPGCTAVGTMETLNPPTTVAQLQPAFISRPGPVCGSGEGVFQAATYGKYVYFSDQQSADPLSASSPSSGLVSDLDFDSSGPSQALCHPTAQGDCTVATPTLSSILLQPSRSYLNPGRIIECTPGRNAVGTMETLEPPTTVVQLQPALTSRPGPVCGWGEGVLQAAMNGKYVYSANHPSVDFCSASSRSSDQPGDPGSGPSGNFQAEPRPIPQAVLSLTIFYQNVRGLRTKTKDLRLALSSSDYDVVALTETWLSSDVLNSELSSDYEIYRLDRNPSTSQLLRGGGVLIGVKKHLRCKLVSLVNANSLEQVAVCVSLPMQAIYICCVYIRPNSAPSIYADHASCVQQLCDIAKSTDTVVALGDYNLPMLSWELDADMHCYIPINASSEPEIVLTQSILACGLQQIQDICNVNGRLLDLAFVSDTDRIELFESPCGILKLDAHHRPFIVKIDYIRTTEDFVSARYYYDYDSCDEAAVHTRLQSLDWATVLADCDVDHAVLRFYDVIFDIIHECIPTRQRLPRVQFNQPWWTPELRNLRNRLRKTRKRFIKLRSEENKRLLRDMEELYSSRLNTVFHEYVLRNEANAKRDPSTFWSFVKKLRRNGGIPQDVFLNEARADSAVAATELFAKFFKSVFSNIHPSHTPDEHRDWLAGIAHHNMYLPHLIVSIEDVKEALSSVDSSKGPGPDSLPPSFIKQFATSLAPPVSIIFNRSLDSGIFPTMWKVASIIPIHKAGNVHDVENYRGISILSCLPKVLEKMVYDVVYHAVQPLISEHQHGFMRKRSTTTNLMVFVNSLIKSIEKRRQVDAIYIDFSKAFDKVPHALAVEKIRCMGLPNWVTQWIQSYLTERFAFVSVNGINSACFEIPSGVPQGSHLGPLIFVLFVNELCSRLNCSKLMFADDLKIFREIKTALDGCALQSDIDTLSRWCTLNGMQVNVTKCCVISFSRLRDPLRNDYTIEQSHLRRVQVVKDLGVTIDCKARFNEHISTVTAKAFAILGFVKRNTKAFQDIYALKSLYCALVRSILEYAVVVWAPYHAVHINRMEAIQKNFLRYALRSLPWNDPLNLPAYEERCKLIDLHSLAARRKLLQRLFVFGLLNGNVDCSTLLSHVNVHVPRRQLRNQFLLWQPSHRTNYGYNEPWAMCCRAFNDVGDVYDFNISKFVYKRRILLLD